MSIKVGGTDKSIPYDPNTNLTINDSVTLSNEHKTYL